jgi:hypothetical protein
VNRLTLSLAVIAMTLCCGSATHAQVGPVYVGCQPLPYWYPRSWEMMIRYPCYVYDTYGSYYRPAYYSYPAAYPYRRSSIQVHRRPYLRPGWWW